MPQWATFVGLTGVVTVLLLALSYVSQSVIEERPPSGTGIDEEGEGKDRNKDGDTAAAPGYDEGGEDGSENDHRARTDANGGPEEPELSAELLLANVALSQGLFAAVLLAAAWYTEIPPAALGIGAGADVTGLDAVGLGLGLGLALYLGSEAGGAAADRLGFDYDERLRGMLAPDSTKGWTILLGIVLPIIAAFEEFLFRAAMIGAVTAGYGVSPWLLAAVSSVLFALGHGAQGRVGIVVTGTLGLLLAGAFVLTGSLTVVIVAHYVVNALEFVVHEGLGIDLL